MTGVLYGLGLGPGDPELITLKALRILQRVPVLAWPAPLEGNSFARSIAAPHLNGSPLEIPIRMPMQSNRFPAQEVYDRAAQNIGEQLRAGRDVAILCEGDPFFYGSFIHLFDRMAGLYPVKVVPGVSSLTAAASVIPLPLISGNGTLSVVPAPLAEEELERRMRMVETAVLLKVGRHLSKVKRVLSRLGLLEAAWFVEYASLPQQQVQRLMDMDREESPYFSMVVVRKEEVL